MTTVRIVPARHIRPARAPDGSDVPDWWPHQRLIVLADDAGHRAVPLWLVAGHKGLLGRLGRPAADAEVTSGLLETAVRLLRTAGTAVSAVDIEPASDDVPELRSDTVTARVGLATATGTRPVTVSAEYGLALAAVAGAPVRVADAVMDRLAVSVPGEDMLAPFLPPADARPPGRPRRHGVSSRGTWRSPTAWTTGNWLAASPMTASRPGRTTPAPPRTSPRSWPPRSRNPPASAVLVQAIAAEDYRGRTVTFRGQLRATGMAGQAGLHLAVSGPRRIDGCQAPARPRQQPDRPGQQRLDLA